MQKFLGNLNYVSDYFQGLRKICRPLYKRLEKNPPAWTDKHTMIVRQIKKYVKQLPCIVIPSPHAFKIVEIDASDIGYSGILKQVAKDDAKEQIVIFHSSSWITTQQNYSTIKKEILFIILCVSKFQNDLFNQKFLIRVDCKSAKEVLQKDVENLVSKQSFARCRLF